MKKFICILAVAALALGCSDYNKLPLFEGSYVYFNTSKSGYTSINELGRSTTSYYINYVGPMSDGETIEVAYSVTPGNGLAEDVDYQMVSTSRTLSFSPGVYSLGIHVRWLANEIDPSKDNTLTLRIESCSKEGVALGVLGPDEANRSIVISKFKNQ